MSLHRPSMLEHPARSEGLARDQAAGLRRLFATSATCFIPMVANPMVANSGVAVERLSAALSLLGRHTLIVDAAESSPSMHEAATFGLRLCVEPLTPRVSYLAARGLPGSCVDTQGSSARLLDDLVRAAPQADVVLVHAAASDLVRMFTGHLARPILLAADHPDSLKHAYAAWKLLAQRRGWLSSDLILLAPPTAHRVPLIAASLSRCADSFVGGTLAAWAAVDPDCAPHEIPDATLHRIAATQLELHAADVAALPAVRPATFTRGVAAPVRS